MPDKNQSAKASSQEANATQASKSMNGNRKKPLIIAAIVIAAIAVLVGVIYFFSLRQNPENVVMNAIIKATEADKLQAKGTIETTLERFNGKLKVEFSSVKADKNGQMDAKVSYQSDAIKKAVKTNGQVILGEDGTVYLKLKDVKSVVSAAYTEIGSMYQQIQIKGSSPYTFSPNKLIINASEFLNDKWIKLPPGQADGNSSLNPFSCVQGVVAKYNANSSERRAIIKAYRNNDFLMVDSKSLDDKDGSDGYRVSIDEDKFKTFEQAAKKTTLGKMMAKCVSESSDSSSSQDEILDGHIDLWINKYSQQITHVQLDNQTTKFDATFDYGADTKVSIPSEAKTIEDIFSKPNLEAEAKKK